MKSFFKEDHVDLRLPKEGKIRTTLSELIYYSAELNQTIIVSKGLETDLGSIPFWLQWIFPKDGLAVLAYILHDYLYKIGFKGDRNVCDDLIVEAMEALGVKRWRRVAVRHGLKVGGWYSWNKHRKKDKK